MIQPIQIKTYLSNNLEAIKKIPIISLLPTGTITKRSGNKTIVCCPIHNESNPSMAIYEGNTWYCFACGIGGSNIDFYMKLHDVDFKTALKEMKQ